MCRTPNGDTYYQPKDDKPYTANDPKFVFSGWRSPGDSKARLKVPEGMLKAAIERSRHSTLGLSGHDKVIENVVEAALLWQKTNSPKPTQQQALELRNLALAVNRNYGATEPTEASCLAVAVDWVGRMYDAPEPEAPVNIEDLLLPNIESGFFKPEVLNERLHEAFRRGQQSKLTTGR
jgi:hypothetical protein